MLSFKETLEFGYNCKHSVRYNALEGFTKDAHLKSVYISTAAFEDKGMDDLPKTITISVEESK